MQATSEAGNHVPISNDLRGGTPANRGPRCDSSSSRASDLAKQVASSTRSPRALCRPGPRSPSSVHCRRADETW